MNALTLVRVRNFLREEGCSIFLRHEIYSYDSVAISAYIFYDMLCAKMLLESLD